MLPVLSDESQAFSFESVSRIIVEPIVRSDDVRHEGESCRPIGMVIWDNQRVEPVLHRGRPVTVTGVGQYCYSYRLSSRHEIERATTSPIAVCNGPCLEEEP